MVQDRLPDLVAAAWDQVPSGLVLRLLHAWGPPGRGGAASVAALMAKAAPPERAYPTTPAACAFRVRSRTSDP